MIFGVEIAYQEFFPEHEPDLEGHPVRVNNSVIIPVVSIALVFHIIKLVLVFPLMVRQPPSDGESGSFES